MRNLLSTVSAVLFVIGTMTIAAGVIVWVYSPPIAGAMFGAGAVVSVMSCIGLATSEF